MPNDGMMNNEIVLLAVIEVTEQLEHRQVTVDHLRVGSRAIVHLIAEIEIMSTNKKLFSLDCSECPKLKCRASLNSSITSSCFHHESVDKHVSQTQMRALTTSG